MADKVVTLGNKAKTWFPPQFRGDIDARSLTVTPIEYYGAFGDILAEIHATGFFYRLDDAVYLVSARHALTGLDAFSREPFSKSKFLPTRVRVYPCIRSEPDSSRVELDVDVRAEDGTPLWLEDPEFGQLNTDIACVKIDHPESAKFWCLESAQDENLYSAIGFDCFVAGYPNRNYYAPHLPIWRRGSFAYEPTMPIDDRPMFLVDAATSPGLSGAPIFQRSHGPAPIFDENGEISIKLEAIVATRFVGVYGGRLDHTNQLAQVGYGWYANRIPMIISGKPEQLPGKPVVTVVKFDQGFGFGGGVLVPPEISRRS